MSENSKIFEYNTTGTCCKKIQVEIEDGKIKDAIFFGGCNGNLKGIRSLILGQDVDSVIDKLQGITCGAKTTSCPDQLSKCLVEYKNSSLVVSK